MLILNEANIEAKTEYDLLCTPLTFSRTTGDTALHIVSARGNVEFVNYLCTKNVDLESKNNAGDTPLIVACRQGQLLAAKELLEAGAKCNVKNLQGETALRILQVIK
jgi:ankyrin repeat protein